MLSISYYIYRLFRALSRRIPYFQNLFRLLRFFTSYSKQKSLELFANAVEDYYSNTMKSKFIFFSYCLQKEYNGLKSEHDLGIYFRTWDKLDPLERKLINLSYGNILDVGSCTGYYIPYLMDKGTVTGIEISPKINKIAQERGISNTIIGDIFKYKFSCKFDTITLIGNDIALSGTLYRLKKLLKKFKALLSKNGQVLLIISHVRTLRYWHVVYTPHYNGRFGNPFKLLFLNANFLLKFSSKLGFQSSIKGKITSKGDFSYLIRLIKTST